MTLNVGLDSVEDLAETISADIVSTVEREISGWMCVM